MSEPHDADSLGVKYASPDPSVKPLYLFADSQILFWKPEGEPFLARVRDRLMASSPLAAYVGASNGDDPAFYSIFEAAMDEVGITERRMIPTEIAEADLDFIEEADLVLLAGGDVETGWRAFTDNGLKQILQRRYYEGAMLMGISAGAVQLGLGGWAGGAPGGRFVDTFRLLPHVVGAHEEDSEWAALKAAVERLGEHTRGYGIPFGGGLVYHPDHTVEPLRRPAYEFRLRGKRVEGSMIVPGEVAEEEGDEAGDDTGEVRPEERGEFKGRLVN